MKQKIHEKEIKQDDLIQKMKGMPLDYSIYDTEDETFSDYEIDEKDLYPETKSNGKK